jgi:hypothetical protein
MRHRGNRSAQTPGIKIYSGETDWEVIRAGCRGRADSVIGNGDLAAHLSGGGCKAFAA